ncbi:MAG: hypothetical protein IPJ56_00140 [Gemmatimonadetes bacterium]|nr:hypothetical protein [Gemmatimonadota bacterium]
MSMFGAIYRFELRYHFTRPITWLYFTLFVAGAFAFVTTDTIGIAGGSGMVMRNAPSVIVRTMLLIVVLGQIVVSGLVGSSVLRDYQFRTHELVFTTPITRFAYLGGRFLGAFTVMVFVHAGMIVGMVVGSAMPWLDKARLLPLDLSSYVIPFLTLVVPAILVISAIFLAVGALTRSAFAIHTQGIVLLIGFSIAQSLIGKLDNRTIAALLDPIGLTAFELVMRYWSVAERNTRAITLGGVLLANRLLWTAAALGVAGLTVALFRFRSAPPALRRRRRPVEEAAPSVAASLSPTLAIDTQTVGWRPWWVQLVSTAQMSFRSIVRQLPFAVIVVVGLINLGIAVTYAEVVFGQTAWPVTYTVVEVTSSQFTLFFMVLIALFAGELVWRERELGADQIVDALPGQTSATMVGKFLGLVLVEGALLAFLMGAGMLYQLASGYSRFEPFLYITFLFGTVLPSLVQLTALAGADPRRRQPEVPGARTGDLRPHPADAGADDGAGTPAHAIRRGGALSLLGHERVRAVRPGARLDHAVLVGGGGAPWRGGVPHLGPWQRAVVAGASSRGRAALARRHAWRGVRGARCRGRRVRRPLPQHQSCQSLEELDDRPPREGELREGVQGALTPAAATPHSGRRARRPRPGAPLVRRERDLHLREQSCRADRLAPRRDDESRGAGRLAGVGRTTTALVEDSLQDVRLYRLDVPLAPNDTITLRYRGHYDWRGFPSAGPDTSTATLTVRNAIAANGTFLNFEYFPFLGYLKWRELESDNARHKEQLAPQVRAAPLENEQARDKTYLGINADWIRFRATVSTAPDQIAIAPGELVREYRENGRRVFEYQATDKMLAFFSFLSARYEVKRDQWNGIPLDIYYHKGHEFNLDRMVASMRASLQDFSTRYSPFQFKQFRIVEFPRYSQFAQAFPATIPFSENIGFILRAGTTADDIDTPFYVTSHEIAHQWWFHQVVGADVQGATMLSESLANYSAILVMEQTFGSGNIRKFLRQQLDGYLVGRGREAKAERPLMRVENQMYIHYNKGSLALYALRDLIGDAAMNRALRRFVADKAFQKPLHHQPRAARLPGVRDAGLAALRDRRLVPYDHTVGQLGGGGRGLKATRREV